MDVDVDVRMDVVDTSGVVATAYPPLGATFPSLSAFLIETRRVASDAGHHLLIKQHIGDKKMTLICSLGSSTIKARNRGKKVGERNESNCP